jgi:hypothetical protein
VLNGTEVKTRLIALVSAFLLTTDAHAAFKYKRFPAEGLVTVKTCECHATTRGTGIFAMPGEYCHTYDGTCHR